MQSSARTVEEYLDSLPEDRRAALEALRRLINANLDPDFEEGMNYGHIGWYVPHSIYPKGYHADPKQPVPFLGLAAQKNNLALYMMDVPGDFKEQWAKTGKKLDMGKGCIRFKKVEALALDVIAAAICGVKAREYATSRERPDTPRSRP